MSEWVRAFPANALNKIGARFAFLYRNIEFSLIRIVVRILYLGLIGKNCVCTDNAHCTSFLPKIQHR